MSRKKTKIAVLQVIMDDVENDAKSFDGRPFNGRVVGEYFGKQGAAISELAKILQSVLEENESLS